MKLQQRHFFLCLILIALTIALSSRLILASRAQFPGHADYAFHYTVAENLADGRGFQVDYIWNYLSSPRVIPYVSNDYWMPLTSVIISLSFLIFGKTLFAALLPSIFFGLFLSIPVYFLSRIYSNSRFVAFCSSGLVLFVPSLFRSSLLTDTSIYYALFVSLSLLFMIKGLSNMKFFLLSAACIGLAHLTRQDGILLIPVLIIVIMLAPKPKKTKFIYLLFTFAIYLFILSPLLIKNYKTFGAFFPPGPFKTLFLTQYEDLYSFSRGLSLKTYLQWGVSNILRSKIHAVINYIFQLYNSFDFWIFVIIGILEVVILPAKRRDWKIYVPPVLFLGLLFIFYTFIASIIGSAGGFQRSVLSILPFLLIISLDFVHRNIPSKTIVFLLVALITIKFFSASLISAKSMIASNNRMGHKLAHLKEFFPNVNHSGCDKDVVIMTRNPWEVYCSTRCKAIQIPNENLDTIFNVAQRYKANYLLLPAPRQALDGIYQGNQSDKRFELISIVPDSNLKLFRVKLN